MQRKNIFVAENRIVDEISAHKFICFAHGTFWKYFGPIYLVSLFYIMSAAGRTVGFAFLLCPHLKCILAKKTTKFRGTNRLLYAVKLHSPHQKFLKQMNT
jgi:hypothetical protein